MADTSKLEDVPDELLAHVGESLQGWAHLRQDVAQTLPTSLRRANLIRRGALIFLTKPRRQGKAG